MKTWDSCHRDIDHIETDEWQFGGSISPTFDHLRCMAEMSDATAPITRIPPEKPSANFLDQQGSIKPRFATDVTLDCVEKPQSGPSWKSVKRRPAPIRRHEDESKLPRLLSAKIEQASAHILTLCDELAHTMVNRSAPRNRPDSLRRPTAGALQSVGHKTLSAPRPGSSTLPAPSERFAILPYAPPGKSAATPAASTPPRSCAWPTDPVAFTHATSPASPSARLPASPDCGGPRQPAGERAGSGSPLDALAVAGGPLPGRMVSAGAGPRGRLVAVGKGTGGRGWLEADRDLQAQRDLAGYSRRIEKVCVFPSLDVGAPA
jgi:hypothetical protein